MEPRLHPIKPPALPFRSQADPRIPENREPDLTRTACYSVHEPQGLRSTQVGRVRRYTAPHFSETHQDMIHTRASKARLAVFLHSLPCQIVQVILHLACNDDVDEEWAPRKLISAWCRYNSPYLASFKMSRTTAAVSVVNKKYSRLLLPTRMLTSRNIPARIGFVVDTVACTLLRYLKRLPDKELSVSYRTSGHERLFEILYCSVYLFSIMGSYNVPYLRPGELGPLPRTQNFLQNNAMYWQIVASYDRLISHFAMPLEKRRFAQMLADVFAYPDHVFVIQHRMLSIFDVVTA